MPVILNNKSITKINDTFPSPGVEIETFKTSSIRDGDTVVNVPVVPLPQVVSSPNVSSETIDASYKYMAFTHSGGSENQTEYSLLFNTETECDILIVAGGGGGGSTANSTSVPGSGGGAGGLIFLENQTVDSGTYTIKVGKGGNKAVDYYESGQNGYNSSFSYLQTEAIGGGGGGSRSRLYNSNSSGNPGGSGGGGNLSDSGAQPAGSGETSDIIKSDGTTIIVSNHIQGNVGGSIVDGSDSPYAGGGGGAGGRGQNNLETPDTTDGDGGIGKSGEGSIDFKTLFGITDTTIGEHHTDNKVYFAGGGACGETGGNESTGGLGGGGDGHSDQLEKDGKPNTGGGGAGSKKDSSPYGNGGNGGSGIVIIRYKVTDATMEPQPITYYTPERMYPPVRNLTSNSHVISGEAYGNGLYEVSVSTEYDTSFQGNKAFNISYTGGFASAQYQYPSGVYNLNNYIVSDYKGDWVKIKLPYAITLTKYGFQQRPGSFENKAPGKYKIYGSNDDTNWDILVHKTDKITYNLQISESNDYFEENLNVNQTYQYFALVVNELSGTGDLLNFAEWYIYGQEYINEDSNYKTLTFTYDATRYPEIDADATNLKVWYKFDGDTNDSNPSSTKYNLTNNSVSFVDGIVNQAASFDNNADLLTSSSFNLTDLLGQNFTFSFWTKVKSGIATYGQLMHFISGSSVVYFRRAAANRLEFWIDDGSGRLFTLVSSDYTLDVWRHYTITYNNTEAKLYLDGVLYQTVSTGNTLNIGSGTMRIGDRSNNDQSFRGEIDDFRIYDKELTAYEINTLYNVNQTPYTLTFDNPAECDILIVGGGGGGGSGADSGVPGGGGGAGGLIFLQSQTVDSGTYTIKVGKGGNRAVDNSESGQNGFNSLFSYLQTEAIGGGGGGSRMGIAQGQDGGSGGGGTRNSDESSALGGSGTIGIIYRYDGNIIETNYRQGFEGGYEITGSSAGDTPFAGGGGGAGGRGQHNNDINDGDGGIGKSGEDGIDFKTFFGISNTAIGEHHTDDKVYFSGGGAAGYANNGNTGGLGGGGDGHSDELEKDGKPNTGGGGAGSKTRSTPYGNGGNGGSGIVIIRYKTQYNQVPFNAQWTYRATDTSVHHYGNVGIGTTASDTISLGVRGDVRVTGDYYQNNETFGKWLKNNNHIYRDQGTVGIGTLNPRYNLEVVGEVYASEGGISGNGSTNWTTTSDSRIKENIVKASYKECYEIFKKIDLYRFNYNGEYMDTTDENQLGFIAQEVQTHLPNSVQERKMKFKNGLCIDDILTLNVTEINYILFGAFKYLIGELEIIKKHLPEPIVVDTNTETNTDTIEDTTLETDTIGDTTLETNTIEDTTLETNTESNTGIETSMEPIQVDQEIL